MAAQLFILPHPHTPHSSKELQRTTIIMSSLSSATIRERKLREIFSPRQTPGEGQSCHWSEETIRARENRSDLVAEINDVLERLLDDKESSGKVNCIEVPDCVHKRTPCDQHNAALFDFVRQCGPETFQIHQKQLLLLDDDQDWNSSEAETDSDLDSNHEELHSSSKENRNPGDDEDDIKHEDDDDRTPRSIKFSPVEEDDKKEIIRKDEASVRCLQFIKVNDDRERWLVPISIDDELAESTDELHQCKPVTQPFRTPSRATSDRARGPSAGAKDDPSLLQLVYQIDSAKKDFLEQCYKENPSYRTLIAWITLSIDPSCYQDVKINEEVVRQRIMAPFIYEASDPSLAKEGFVYAFRDNDFQLIKIGSSTSLEKRKAEIERKCGFVNGLTLVAAAKVKAYKRVEDIVHQDLAPHRRFFDCACGQSTTNKGFTRHQEYFQIDDAAAVRTLQLWVDFVQEQPWEQDPWTGRFKRNIGLKKEWRDKLLKPSGVKSHENHEDHDERTKRWRDFLNIRTPKAVIIKDASTSFVTSGSTMDQERAVAAATRFLSPAGTPSKPPRSPVDDVPVIKRSTKPSAISSGPLKTSPSSKPEKVEHMQEQDTCSTAPQSIFGLPHRSKNKGSTPDDPIVIDDINTEAKRECVTRTVHSAETKPPSVLQNIAEKQPYAADRFQIFSDMTPSEGTDPLSSPEQVVTSDAQKCPAGRGLFAHHQFDTIWSPPAGNHPTSPTQASRTIKPEQLANDELLSAPIQHSKTPQQNKSGEEPRTDSNQEETTPSQMQSSRGHATTNAIVASPLAKSIIDLATKLLAREVRPLPARTVSRDLWQLRWPLACSVVLALLSPHIPSVLSFLMWSIFLPFFVAELRGWSVVI